MGFDCGVDVRDDLWVVRVEAVAVHSNLPMNNFHCLIQNDRVEIFRGRKMLGTVVQIGEGEPTLTVFCQVEGTQEFTFGELAIIQDNWVACDEMIKKRIDSQRKAAKVGA
jgi:hypothetical protein